MNITERLKYIITEENLTLTQLNDLMNKKNGTNYTMQNLSRKLNNDNLKFNDVEDILNILGYKIVFTKINNESKEETDIDNISISNLLDVDIDDILKKEFKKYLEKLISLKTKKYFEKLLSDLSNYEKDNYFDSSEIDNFMDKYYKTLHDKQTKLK